MPAKPKIRNGKWYVYETENDDPFTVGVGLHETGGETRPLVMVAKRCNKLSQPAEPKIAAELFVSCFKDGLLDAFVHPEEGSDVDLAWLDSIGDNGVPNYQIKTVHLRRPGHDDHLFGQNSMDIER